MHIYEYILVCMSLHQSMHAYQASWDLTRDPIDLYILAAGYLMLVVLLVMYTWVVVHALLLFF